MQLEYRRCLSVARKKKKPNMFIWTIKRIGEYIKEDFEGFINGLLDAKASVQESTNKLEKILKEMMTPVEYKIYRAADNFLSLWSLLAAAVGIYSIFKAKTIWSFLPLFSIISLLSAPVIWSKLYSKKINIYMSEYEKKHEWDIEEDGSEVIA